MAKKTKKDINSDILEKARKRFKASAMYEYTNRSEGLDDLKFKLGGRNQWPDDIATEREDQGRPVLTINKIPTFTDQIIGDSRQNKISIKVRSTGRRGSTKIANIYTGLIRNIEKESRADAIYQWGLQGAVDAGRGVWRIDTEFINDNIFDQEIRLKRIKNPFSVYFDPKAEDYTYCDGMFCFVTSLITEEDYENRWPGKTPSNFITLGLGDDLEYWFIDNQYRVAEYWIKEPIRKRIYLLDDDRVVDADDWDSIVDDLRKREQAFHVVDGSPVEGEAEFEGQPETVINRVPEIEKERTIDSFKVMQYIIDGAQILEGPNEWAGKYIPIIPVWGKEINIEGKSYYRGIIRNAKDPQAMYNWERTEEIERTALYKQPPVRLTPEQIEGHEAMYSGERSYKYQLYNFVPGLGAPIDVVPPQASSGNIAQSTIANDEIRATTGLEAPSLGKASSAAASGKKELVLQAKSSTANFEFHDNLERSIEYTGTVLVDLMPKIYDTERIIMMVSDDGTESEETINQKIVDEETGNEITINDISVGEYSVSVMVGPSFSTKKLETVSVLTELISRIPSIGQVGADMIVKNIDFVGNEELSERLKNIGIKAGYIEDPKAKAKENQPPGPEQIKAMLDIEAQKIENKGKELEVAQQLLELQKMMSQMKGELAQVAQASAQGAVMQVLQKLGIAGGQQPQGIPQQ